jgi:hypothetical protein
MASVLDVLSEVSGKCFVYRSKSVVLPFGMRSAWCFGVVLFNVLFSCACLGLWPWSGLVRLGHVRGHSPVTRAAPPAKVFRLSLLLAVQLFV